MPEVVWVAIIGAVAGLLAGLGGAYITVRAQAKQADRERWAHRRQEAYTDVIIAADDLADEISDWWVRGSAGLIHDADNDLPEPIKTTVKAAYDRASVRAELIASWRGSVKPRLDMLDAAAWSARLSTHGLEGQSRQEVVDAVGAGAARPVGGQTEVHRSSAARARGAPGGGHGTVANALVQDPEAPVAAVPEAQPRSELGLRPAAIRSTSNGLKDPNPAVAQQDLVPPHKCSTSFYHTHALERDLVHLLRYTRDSSASADSRFRTGSPKRPTRRTVR